MNKILQSILERFNRLAYPQKFTVVTVIFVLPIIAFLPLVGDQSVRIDQYGRKELFGALYLRQLWQLTDDIQMHQLVSRQYLDGEIQFSEVESLQTEIDTDFERYRRIHNEYRETLPLGNDDANEIEAQWLALKSAIQNGTKSDLDLLHENLLSSIHSLVIHVGDISYLILDPDLDTYYMMDTVLLKMPENQRLIFEIFQLAKKAARSQSLSVEEQAQLTVLVSQLDSNLSVMDRNIGVALQNNRNRKMRPLVFIPFEDYQTTMKSLINYVRTRMLNSSSNSTSPNILSLSSESGPYEQARQSNLAFYTVASEALEGGIVARINSLIIRFYSIAVIALFSVSAAYLIGRSIMNAISQPLVQLAQATQRLAGGDMTARVSTENIDELGQVASAFNLMADELEADKRILLARARDLESANLQSEKRAQELQAISEISRIISTEQKLETLLALITRLVSERFDFYHVGIFLIDNAQQFAVLQAANSEGGQRMLERRHKLEIGHTGIVGNVAQTGKPRIALNVGSDAVYFDNPDLPNTRSEMALPLNLRGETVGVMDVQSLKPGAFNESDANTLGILADHVAITIDNARLFEQSQQALNELQSLYRQYQAQEWDAFVKRESKIGYHQLPVGGKLLNQLVKSNEIEEALEKGEISKSSAENGTSDSSIAVPVKLRGQIIGVLSVKPPKSNRTWNQDEINLMQAISDRLALALDNARLLQESQRRAAKEQKIGDVTAKIGASINMRSVLQTAVEELGRALPGSEVVIQFENNGK